VAPGEHEFDPLLLCPLSCRKQEEGQRSVNKTRRRPSTSKCFSTVGRRIQFHCLEAEARAAGGSAVSSAPDQSDPPHWLGIEDPHGADSVWEGAENGSSGGRRPHVGVITKKESQTRRKITETSKMFKELSVASRDLNTEHLNSPGS